VCLHVHSVPLLMLSALLLRPLDSLLSFPSPAVHCDLHSFPTRRSSDLVYSSARASTLLATTVHSTLAAVCTIWRVRGCSCVMSRSEEHTSELQSRFDLVCRLLLEKKKITSGCSCMDKHVAGSERRHRVT